MENDSEGMAWVGNMFQKFEDMCLEVDDIVRQEGLKYVEGQLQTVGANVKQFCSEFVRDVLSTSFEDAEEDSDDKLSFIAKDDMAEEILKDGIAEYRVKKDLSCSLQSIKGKEKESNSEEDVNARKRLEVVSILEKWLEEKYAEHLMLDKIPFQKKDEGLSMLPAETDDAPGSCSYTKSNSIDVSSCMSVSLVDSRERMVLDDELISRGASAKSVGKQGNLMGGIYEEKLDGSCIVVDRRELGYVSGEARSFSYHVLLVLSPSLIQRTGESLFIDLSFILQREEAAKEGRDHGSAEFSNSNLGSIEQKEEVLAASSTAPPNDGSFESDWEIV